MDRQLYEEIIPKLDMATEPNADGRIWSYCPGHADGTKRGKHPGTHTRLHGRSLSLHPKFGLECFAGCTKDDGFRRVLSLLGIATSDRTQRSGSTRRTGQNSGAGRLSWKDPVSGQEVRGIPPGARLVDTYEYLDPDACDVVALKGRWEWDDPAAPKGYEKTFRWWRPGHEIASGLKGADTQLAGMSLWGAELLKEVPLDAPVWFVEGEETAKAVRAAGAIALCCGQGASAKSLGQSLDILRGRKVILWPDNDAAGKEYMRRVHRELQGIAGSVEIIDVDSVPIPPKGDAVDYFDAGHQLEDLTFLAAITSMRLTRLSDVVPEAVSYLWRGYLPKGKLVTIEGDPGLGKSTITLDLVARLTSAASMPDGSVALEQPTRAILVGNEDSLADTVRPRLDAAGGDPKLVYSWPPEASAEIKQFPRDIAELREVIIETGAGVVVIDPLSAHFESSVNSFKEQDVRSVMAELAAVASATGATILLVRHLNKNVGGNAIYRGGGSIGIIAAARVGLLIGKDPASPESGRILTISKFNVGKPGPSLKLRIASADNGQGRIEWLGTSDFSADSLLSAQLGPPATKSARDEAEDFLRDVLANGAVEAKLVKEEALEYGISEPTLRRAQKKLGIKPSKSTGHGGAWTWRLPVGEVDQDDHSDE